MKTTEFNYG